MRRALPFLAVAMAVMASGAFAQTDCPQEIATMQTRLATVDDQAKHRELELLLAKAQNDIDAGQAKLCADDLRHAQQLVK